MLPKELISIVCSFLGPKDIVSLSGINSYTKKLDLISGLIIKGSFSQDFINSDLAKRMDYIDLRATSNRLEISKRHSFKTIIITSVNEIIWSGSPSLKTIICMSSAKSLGLFGVSKNENLERIIIADEDGQDLFDVRNRMKEGSPVILIVVFMVAYIISMACYTPMISQDNAEIRAPGIVLATVATLLFCSIGALMIVGNMSTCVIGVIFHLIASFLLGSTVPMIIGGTSDIRIFGIILMTVMSLMFCTVVIMMALYYYRELKDDKMIVKCLRNVEGTFRLNDLPSTYCRILDPQRITDV